MAGRLEGLRAVVTETDDLMGPAGVDLFREEGATVLADHRDLTDNVEAYTYYLKGRGFFHRGSKSNLSLAKQMFAKAIELDPLYARAYAGATDCDSFLYLQYSEDVSIDGILANCAKALDIDSGLTEARASRRLALSVCQRYREAEAEFEIGRAHV